MSSDDLRKGRVRAEKWPKVLQAVEKLARAPIYVDDSSDMSVLELRAKSRRLAARHGLGLVVVDYLQLMRPEGRAESSRVEQIGQISRGLKILARELNVPVIAVSQLSRAVEARNPPRPMLSDLRESGCLTGESRIYLPETGEYRPIAELVGSSGFEVIAVNRETWKLERRKVTRAFATGRKPVYKLTTQLGRTVRATGNHKFLAFNGWKRLDEVAIEQDADVVMFIYREEYYDKESDRLGEADFMVAKHRNGPIGEVALTFLPKYPKFANLYRDRGAEPMPPQDTVV